jgi:hypothetical protein
MKNVQILKLTILLLTLVVGGGEMWGGTPGWYRNEPTRDNPVVQQEWKGSSIMQTGSTLSNSQIYEVGTPYVPSDYSNPSGSAATGEKITGPRKLGGGTDPGEQSEQFPIGEPWIMLLFALAACGVIANRRKKSQN